MPGWRKTCSVVEVVKGRPVATYELPSALKCRVGGEMLMSPGQVLHPRQKSCLESLTSSLPSAFGVQSQNILLITDALDEVHKVESRDRQL
ncbi:hypothetical protein V495_04529 [Pseudogymnoascus sp. VKM F-4514 (FW-929)]|nr:hypothetical protein V490_07689 [Pseudogymnoascus sp. VKM F-3557]KFY42420.1 hypothetical protein V495_04529 [Pseudogymnoascus sp. VKM F-4514 (FW-929)]